MHFTKCLQPLPKTLATVSSSAYIKRHVIIPFKGGGAGSVETTFLHFLFSKFPYFLAFFFSSHFSKSLVCLRGDMVIVRLLCLLRGKMMVIYCHLICISYLDAKLVIDTILSDSLSIIMLKFLWVYFLAFVSV